MRLLDSTHQFHTAKNTALQLANMYKALLGAMKQSLLSLLLLR